MTRNLRTALAELESRLHQAEAPILAGLRPGLTRAETTMLLAGLGQRRLDAGLVALYMWHNGAEGSGAQAELMDAARFLSLQEALETREFELQLAAEVESPPALPAAEIFDPKWFPILASAHGGIYVVEGLGAGRVLIFEREQSGVQEELSKSLIAFIDSLARDGRDFKPSAPSADVALLVARLESRDERERVGATQELTRKRPGAAFEPLVAMLESEVPQARRNAALILGLLGDRRAIPILIRYAALWSARDYEGVKDATSALSGLRDVSDEGVLVHLEHAMAEGDIQLRLNAIRCFVLWHDARAVPMLLATASHDPDEMVRTAAEEAVRALGEGLG